MYNFGSKILAEDYNLYLTGNALGTVDHEVPNISSMLGIGFGKFGYGQTILQSPVTTDKVTASQWNYILNSIANLSNLQGTAIEAMAGAGTAYATPVVGTKIRAIPNISTNLTTLANNSLDSIGQGINTTHQQVHNANWKNSITFNHTVTFASADHARYFFNAGGQLKLTYAHPVTDAGNVLKMNTLFSNIASINNGIGRVYISSPNLGSIVIKTHSVTGNTFTGITRGTDTVAPIVGILPATIYNVNHGYYGMTDTLTPVVKFTGLNLTAINRFAGYNSSDITTSVMSDGPSTLNGDNGSVITIQTVYTQTPDDGYSRIIASPNASVTLTIIRPSATFLTNTWGTITVNMSSSGS